MTHATRPARLLARTLFPLAACLCLNLLPASPVRAQASDLLRSSPKVLAAFRDVVAGPGQSTVRVQCDGKDAALGVVVGADGWVLTKASELKGRVVCKLKDGRELEARVAGVHEPND